MDKMTALRRVQELRQDGGFTNLITGAGTKRSYTEQFDWRPPRRIAKQQLDSLYEDHELAWKFVDYLPDDGTRNWVHYPSIDKKKQDFIDRLTAETQFRPALNEALRMARLHGGAAIYLPILDGQDDEAPVDYKRIKGMEPAEVIEYDHIWPHELKRSLRHTHYCMQKDGESEHLIHRSRLIIIQGCRVSRSTLLARNGWSQSVIARIMAPLLAWSIAQGTIPQILKDFIVDVIKMTGLNEMSVSSSETDLQDFLDRTDAMSLAISLLNKLVLDKEDELQRNTANVAGLDGLMTSADRRLVTASGMPYQKVIGLVQGNAMSSSGDSQDREWNKHVSAYQKDTILPALEQWLLAVAPMVGEVFIKPEFCALDEPSAKEQAQILKDVAAAAADLAEWDILGTPELATMFKNNKVVPVPQLDVEKREELDNKGLLDDLTETQLLQQLMEKLNTFKANTAAAANRAGNIVTGNIATGNQPDDPDEELEDFEEDDEADV